MTTSTEEIGSLAKGDSLPLQSDALRLLAANVHQYNRLISDIFKPIF